MTVLIQDDRSQQYLAAEGGWTANPAEAENFNAHRLAYTYARQSTVAEFNIVLYFPVTGFSLRVDRGRNAELKAFAAA